MAPNVVTIVLDDLGFAQLGCFGADIATPNIDRLASRGLRYNRFHVTALCSPTRASLLTGRNHHAVGVGFLVDIPFEDPGYTARIPRTAATLPRILRDNDYATLAVGKWHLTPIGERSHAGPFTQWPLGVGFESYYGFLQGGTNHWSPHLVRDNHYIEPPATPKDGYHLTEDLADIAIRSIIDRRQAAPGKPFYLYFATGAPHAPHHVGKQWSDRYAGAFDDGWERWRERTFGRQLEQGIVPEGTTLTPRPSWVPAWDDLDADSRRLFSRMQEVYAGFVSHTDAQIGRILDSLDAQGILDDTIIMVFSDNGASAEGGQVGTFNEHRFSLRIPETVEDNLAHLDDWGGHSTYSHYAWGWAWAGNTPLRLWKRYTWLGGCRTPLVVHWPDGIDTVGEVRDQFCHVTDLMPTVLDACGLKAPEQVDGVDQQRLDGASLLSTFGDAAAPPPRSLQYFEMLGSRSIVSGEWKATTDHVSSGVPDEERLLEGSRSFDDDQWALFHFDDDFSEAHDVAVQHPDVVEELARLWDIEAERNNVLPLADSLTNRLDRMARPRYPPDPRSVFVPTASPVCDESVPRLVLGGRVTATVDSPADPAGVLCALGDWVSGFSLYVDEGHLTVTVVIGGDATTVIAERAVPIGRGELAFSLAPRPNGGVDIELFHGGERVGTGVTPHSLPVSWQHGGTLLSLGHDRHFPVSTRYEPPFRWNGELDIVVIDAPPKPDPSERDVSDALHAE